MHESHIPSNVDLGKTQITDKIRVSSAAIFREDWHGNHWIVETWCFSDDPKQRSFQSIHGTPSYFHGEKPNGKSVDTAIKAHRYISENMIEKHRVNNLLKR